MDSTRRNLLFSSAAFGVAGAAHPPVAFAAGPSPDAALIMAGRAFLEAYDAIDEMLSAGRPDEEVNERIGPMNHTANEHMDRVIDTPALTPEGRRMKAQVYRRYNRENRCPDAWLNPEERLVESLCDDLLTAQA